MDPVTISSSAYNFWKRVSFDLFTMIQKVYSQNTQGISMFYR